MKIYLDTEFIDTGQSLSLVSVALVKETGAAYYAVSAEFDPSQASEWVKQKVLAQLEPPSERISLAVMREQIVAFIGYELPQIWAYFGAFDWVLMLRLFGGFEKLPYNFPFYFCELRQEIDRLRFAEKDFPPNPQPHHALSDAQWARAIDQKMQRFCQ